MTDMSGATMATVCREMYSPPLLLAGRNISKEEILILFGGSIQMPETKGVQGPEECTRSRKHASLTHAQSDKGNVRLS